MNFDFDLKGISSFIFDKMGYIWTGKGLDNNSGKIRTLNLEDFDGSRVVLILEDPKLDFDKSFYEEVMITNDTFKVYKKYFEVDWSGPWSNYHEKCTSSTTIK